MGTTVMIIPSTATLVRLVQHPQILHVGPSREAPLRCLPDRCARRRTWRPSLTQGSESSKRLQWKRVLAQTTVQRIEVIEAGTMAATTTLTTHCQIRTMPICWSMLLHANKRDSLLMKVGQDRALPLARVQGLRGHGQRLRSAAKTHRTPRIMSRILDMGTRARSHTSRQLQMLI